MLRKKQNKACNLITFAESVYHPSENEYISLLDEHIINAKHCIDARSSLIRRFAPYIKPQEGYARLCRDDIQPKGLMICAALRASMIYQTCGSDKKMTAILYQNYSHFLVRMTGLARNGVTE